MKYYLYTYAYKFGNDGSCAGNYAFTSDDAKELFKKGKTPDEDPFFKGYERSMRNVIGAPKDASFSISEIYEIDEKGYCTLKGNGSIVVNGEV